MKQWLVFALVLGLASVADADAVGPASVSCPSGANAFPAHSPPQGICIPDDCTSDVDCGANLACMDAPLCVVAMPVFERDAGVYPDGGRPAPRTIDTTPSACSVVGASCGVGTCDTRRVCLPPPSPPATCGCGITARSPWSAVVLIVTVLGAITLRRRARGRD